MSEATINRQAVLDALAALEVQRETQSGNEEWQRALSTAATAMLDKLASLQAAPEPPDEGRQLAVLVADLSGFTALSESMDAERVREALNSIWRELDRVVVDWGGTIDQHAGDSVIALFGHSRPRPHDCACACRAALDMQLELALFNRRAGDMASAGRGEGWLANWPSPQMRVGIDVGPVYFAEGAAGLRPTAVGQTVQLARQIEEMAPPGGILVSAAARAAAGPLFSTVSLPAEKAQQALAGQSVAQPPVLLLAEAPAPAHWTPDLIAGRQSRLIGRSTELDNLELALQQAADSRSAQVVVLAGPPGAGKARLLREFDERTRLFGERRTVLRGSGLGAPVGSPYGVLREIFARRFGIRSAHSSFVVAERLRLGLAPFIARLSSDAANPMDDDDLARLVDLLAGDGALFDPPMLAFSVRRLLQLMAVDGPLLLLIDHTDSVDEETLLVIDEILTAPDGLPLLLICHLDDEPVAADRFVNSTVAQFDWLSRSDDPFSHQLWLEIPPLSPIDSRLLANDILGASSPVPMRLVDLLVAESRGNPLYIQGLAQFMIEVGIIQPGAHRQADMAAAEAMRLPKGVAELLRLRYQHLSEEERLVLGAAAASGMVVWDEALRSMALLADDYDGARVEACLAALVARRLLRPDDLYSFADCRAYVFARPLLRRVVYDSLAPRQAATYHQSLASWLVARRRRGAGGRLPFQEMIGWHMAQAGQREATTG